MTTILDPKAIEGRCMGVNDNPSLYPQPSSAPKTRRFDGRHFQAIGKRPVSFKLVLGFAVLFALLKLGAWATTAAGGALCIWAMLGSRQSIQALSLMVAIKFLNPAIYRFSIEFSVIAWVLLLLAGLRLFLSGSLRDLKILIPLFLFALTVSFLFSVQHNNYTDVSAMKLFTFTYGAAALLLGYAGLKDGDAEKLAVWFMSLITAIVLLSLPTLAIPGIGYAVNHRGFQGIMNHPQAFGTILAPTAAWLLAAIFFTKGAKLIKSLAIVLFLVALMLRSEARTSIMALGLSMLATFLVVFFRMKHFKTVRVGRILAVSVAFAGLLGVALASSPSLREHLVGFVFKHHSRTIDQALSSRSGGIASQWRFFQQEPMFGHGFGVYPYGEFPSGIVRVMGLPISAPVEKGFLPTALLEEVGLIGTLPFLYFLVHLGKRVARNGDPRWLAVFFACLFINVGEMVFFSLGGLGLYFWLLLGLSTRIGQKKDLERFKSGVLSSPLTQIGGQKAGKIRQTPPKSAMPY